MGLRLNIMLEGCPAKTEGRAGHQEAAWGDLGWGDESGLILRQNGGNVLYDTTTEGFYNLDTFPLKTPK